MPQNNTESEFEASEFDALAFSKDLISRHRLNAAEEILFGVVERDQTQHLAYFMLGSIFEVKGNFQAADQMYSIASRLRPDLKEYEIKHKNVQKIILSRGSASHIELNTTGAKNFDFLFVPLSRGGSRVLQTYLSVHPDLYVPPRNKLDNALASGQEVQLLTQLRELKHTSAFKKAGLVQHGSLGLNPDSNIPERLSKIVAQDLFIMSVKDPFLACRSIYNHHIVAATSNYSFARCGINWFPDGIALLGLMSGNWKSEPQGQMVTLPEFGWQFLSERLNHGFHYNLVEQNYRTKFERCETIDIVELAEKLESALPRLYSMVGIDETFQHDCFGVQLSDPPHVTMQNNPILTKINDTGLTLTLAYQGFSQAFPEHRELVELAVLEPDERFTLAGLANHNLVLGAYAQDWGSLDRDIRLQLIKGQAFQKLLEDIIFPHWLVCFQYFRELYWPHRWVEGVPAEYIDRIRDFIGDDASKFLKNHPRHESMWPYADALLGN